MPPLTHSVPAAPAFGEAAPIEASPQTLAFLARRRSASAVALTEPAPSDADLATLLRLATRVPDHGKLSPWRFVVLRGEAKGRFIAGLEAIAAARPDSAKLTAEAERRRARNARVGGDASIGAASPKAGAAGTGWVKGGIQL